MAETSPASHTSLQETLDRLAAYEPQDIPVVSLYLNLTPDQHGRDNFESFVRKAFSEHLRAYKDDSSQRDSLKRDQERITAYLTSQIDPSANGLALFASSGPDDLFEAVQMEVPVEDHWLLVGPVPHLYPLVKLIDQYPRHAAVVLDTNQARIFVFALGEVQRREEVTSDKTRRSQVGGWSQARYQRRADNMQVQHVKEVVDALDRVVRDDRIDHVIVAGDDVVIPLFREQLPKHLEEKVIDVLSLETSAPEHEILEATLAAMRQKDADTDGERVEALITAWQSGGLGVMGPTATLKALQMGQVEDLLITGSAGELRPARLPADAAEGALRTETSEAVSPDEQQLKLADELVTRAHQTGARVLFIEDPELLKEFGGVGATLRFRV